VRFTHAELVRFALPLVRPFRTSYGMETARHGFLVHVLGPDGEGWGECVAEGEPLYSPEYSDGAYEVTKRFLLPRLDPNNVQGTTVAERFAPVRGHRMAKAAIEAAVLDAECRMDGVALAERLGTLPRLVPAGVAVGIQRTVGELLDLVGEYIGQGYRRVKLKIEPGNDVAPVRAVRERFGPDLMIQVDANQAYSLADAPVLAKLDRYGLQLIEQPLPEDDLPPSGRGDHARGVQRGEREAGARGRLDGSGSHPRPVPRSGRGSVVRRDAGDGYRARGKPCARSAAGIHAARRLVGLGPLLRAGSDGAVRVGERLPAGAVWARHRSDAPRLRPRRPLHHALPRTPPPVTRVLTGEISVMAEISSRRTIGPSAWLIFDKVFSAMAEKSPVRTRVRG